MTFCNLMCDTHVLQVSDPQLNDTVIQTFSGSVLTNTIIYSSNNTMTIMFRTDENIYMSGFHLSWFLASPPEVVVIDTTTAVTDGNAGAQGVETTPGKHRYYTLIIYTVLS